jgi:Fic family protein
MVYCEIMNQNILSEFRSILFDRTDLERMPDAVWKKIAALNTWGTNAIEGNSITWKDAEQILFDEITPGGKPISDVSETIQHERVFRGLTQRRKHEITLETVQELHEGVFRWILPDAGQWRRNNVRIRGARFSPPRYEKLLSELKNWIEKYREKDISGEDVFETAAWMHYEFERIHPFSDGNGRVGRLLLNLHFMRRNWPPVHVIPFQRDAYLYALNAAAEGNLLVMEEFLRVLMGASMIDLLDSVGTAQDELLSLEDAAKISPYDKKYLALRCKQGELPALKVGREWRTSKRAVQLYKKHTGRK